MLSHAARSQQISSLKISSSSRIPLDASRHISTPFFLFHSTIYHDNIVTTSIFQRPLVIFLPCAPVHVSETGATRSYNRSCFLQELLQYVSLQAIYIKKAITDKLSIAIITADCTITRKVYATSSFTMRNENKRKT